MNLHNITISYSKLYVVTKESMVYSFFMNTIVFINSGVSVWPLPCCILVVLPVCICWAFCPHFYPVLGTLWPILAVCCSYTQIKERTSKRMYKLTGLLISSCNGIHLWNLQQNGSRLHLCKFRMSNCMVYVTLISIIIKIMVKQLLLTEFTHRFSYGVSIISALKRMQQWKLSVNSLSCIK